jgi:hypothetical protein
MTIFCITNFLYDDLFFSINKTMDVTTQRYLMFLFGCMPARLTLVYLAKTLTGTYAKLLSLVLALIGLGFLNIYFFGSEIADRQLEWAGDKKVWWSDLRIVHGALYLLASYLLYKGNETSWLILLVDTIIGFISWCKHHHFI